ncbi:MAG: hypothetical protein ETSY1_00280 [Candidatus Entotheonella factor]|uniref:Uncharacterized protein n=1 Tax=Entotheonella factor TaxID=1429438 RepID=W4M127_ENTF1|nr:hypothetical protein [Candidatus Entotheonella palauensis]ETX03367.1 MAG: hypothetical protein ETSY1_00280 [Candidatus Entotheonella factor]
MRHVITSIPGQIYQGIMILFRQWRDLHAQSWGWGHDEPLPLADEPAPSTPRAALLVSKT